MSEKTKGSPACIPVNQDKNVLERELYEKRFEGEHAARHNMWKILCQMFFQKFVLATDTVLDVPTGYGEFINNIRCQKKLACDINPDAKLYVNPDVNFLLGSSTHVECESELYRRDLCQ